MERAVCNILCNDMQPLRRVTGRRVVQGKAKAAAGKNKQTDALYIKTKPLTKEEIIQRVKETKSSRDDYSTNIQSIILNQHII